MQGGAGVLASEACARKLEETLLAFDKVCGGEWEGGVTGARHCVIEGEFRDMRWSTPAER